MCARWAEERAGGTPSIRAQLRLTGSGWWGSRARSWNSVRQLREQGLTPRERTGVSPRRGFLSQRSEQPAWVFSRVWQRE